MKKLAHNNQASSFKKEWADRMKWPNLYVMRLMQDPIYRGVYAADGGFI